MTKSDPRAGIRRLAIVRAALLLAFVGLAARAANLSVFDERGSDLGERQRHTVLTLAPERGAILDRRGHELALSLDSPSVYAVPGEIENPRETARKLAHALGQRRAEVAARLERRGPFVFLHRWATPKQADRVRKLGLRGIGIVEEPRRAYPQRELAAAVVGFANIDGRGVRGVEQMEDRWLRGTPRRLPVERDGSGALLVDRGDEQWTTSGGDVALSLDAALQADAASALADAVKETRARSGVVVAMDPYSGDLLALAEVPSFDPNHFRELRYDQTHSRIFLDALEPGSTLKAFLVAAALEEGAVTPDEVFDCENGELHLPGKTIHDSHPHGLLRTDEILKVSSNIGAVKIAMALGPAAHAAMLRRFGFGESTGSGFPDESSGLLRPELGNRPVDQATLAFGQGMNTTPLQLAAATAVLANGGQWVRPRLVTARRRPGGRWQTTPIERARRVLSPATAARVRQMLEEVTSPGGTGTRAALRGVRVAGKTGTAQKYDAAAGRYSNSRFVAWFIGMVPAEDPKLVVVVAVDEPRRPLHTGGAAAAPVFARVAAAQLARLGIVTEPERPAPSSPVPPPRPLPETREASAPPPARPLPELTRYEDRVLLPDLRGLTIAEVRAVTERSRLVLEISGSGRAVAQDPPPGTVLAAPARKIRVRFEPGSDAI